MLCVVVGGDVCFAGVGIVGVALAGIAEEVQGEDASCYEAPTTVAAEAVKPAAAAAEQV